MNAIIYSGEYEALTKRLDTVERALAWLDASGRRFTSAAGDLIEEQTSLIRRLLQIEDLTAYDTLD